MPANANKLGIMQNYPDDWQKYYAEKDFASLDPVIRYGATQELGFTWKHLEKTQILSDRQARFMRMGEEAGLNNGLAIPIRMG